MIVIEDAIDTYVVIYSYRIPIGYDASFCCNNST